MWLPHPISIMLSGTTSQQLFTFLAEAPNHSLPFGMGPEQVHWMRFRYGRYLQGLWDFIITMGERALDLGTYQRMSVSWRPSEWSGLVAGPAPSTSTMQWVHSRGVTHYSWTGLLPNFASTDKDPGILSDNLKPVIKRPRAWVFWLLI